MPIKCNSCGGIYSTTQPDGSRYFHACPPIPNPAYNTDPKKGAVDLRETIEQPNKRDENVSHTDTTTQQPVVISGGLGVTEFVKGEKK